MITDDSCQAPAESASQTKLRRDEFFAAKESSRLFRFPSVVGRTNLKLIF